MAPTATPDTTLVLDYGPAISEAIQVVAHGWTRELAIFGTRGDGKTQGLLGATVAHAREHQRRGFPLPVRWMGVTDTHRAHVEKTVPSMQQAFWRGCWRLSDGDHKATFVLDGAPLVDMSLFGIEDRGAMDRVRAETVGVWFEEPAPAAVLVQSSGIGEDAWGLAITSQRLPTHAKVAVCTLNYPDEDHWTWQRFVVRRHPGTAYVRVPPGERASEQDRAEWSRALEGRPDLLRRLLAGEPGTIAQGPAVAADYRHDFHVAREPLEVIPDADLVLAWDSGANAGSHAAVLGQRHLRDVRIYAALTTDNGLEELLHGLVIPWLAQRAPWILKPGTSEKLRQRYDPAMHTAEGWKPDLNPIQRIRQVLKGSARAASSAWQARAHALSVALNAGGTTGPRALQIDPREDTAVLRRALAGRWYYPQRADGSIARDLPKKPNHPWEDGGDALCYALEELAVAIEPDKRRPVQHAAVSRDPWTTGRPAQRSARTALSAW